MCGDLNAASDRPSKEGAGSFAPDDHVSSPRLNSKLLPFRWTPALHERFVTCVNLLGGPQSKYQT